MRRMVFLIVFLAGSALLTTAVADACGDKALRIGRGIRFQRTSNPAAVLIYLPSNAPRASQLQSMLRKAGHKPYTAQGFDSLDNALKTGQYDLVMTEFSAAASVDKQIEMASSHPLIVAVVSERTKAEVTAAKKQYRYIVKNPHSAEQYLDAIDEVMRSKVHLLAKKVRT
jgi:DNA-binding NtrC family response regulator